MPENLPKFWDIYQSMKRAGASLQLKLTAKEMHRASNQYLLILRDDAELMDEFDPKTYADPTGERAVREWLSLRIESDLRAVAS